MSGGARRRWRIRGWLAWFVVLNLLWLVFISAWVVEEAILGLLAAAIGATAAEAVREQGLAGFKIRAHWLLKARVLPGRTIRETVLVLRALVAQTTRRDVKGHFEIVEISLPEDRDEQAAKRALLTVGEGFAPNAYVVAIDNRKGLMLTHELVPAERE